MGAIFMHRGIHYFVASWDRKATCIIGKSDELIIAKAKPRQTSPDDGFQVVLPL